MAVVFDEAKLRQRVLSEFQQLGFQVTLDFIVLPEDKESYRKAQKAAKRQQILQYADFIRQNLRLVERLYRAHLPQFDPHNIQLELRKVEGMATKSFDSMLYKWWSLIWWSMPYQPMLGRQLRYILWDKGNGLPFGIIGLCSPILRFAPRDKYLNISVEDRPYWVNKSLNIHRLGALPPYNQLIGGKMVALAVFAPQVRQDYWQHYKDHLLFLTTLSAFGRSSIYNRLKLPDGSPAAISLGYTRGTGTFHIPDDLYELLLEYLKYKEGRLVYGRGMQAGPSRKLRNINRALTFLGIKNGVKHNIRREVFLFPLAKNLKEIIQKGQAAHFIDYSLSDLQEYWWQRWGLPRLKRKGLDLHFWDNIMQEIEGWFAREKEGMLL